MKSRGNIIERGRLKHFFKFIPDFFKLKMKRTGLFGIAVFQPEAASPINGIAVYGIHNIIQGYDIQSGGLYLISSIWPFNRDNYFLPGKGLEDFSRKSYRGVNCSSYCFQAAPSPLF